MPLELLNYAEVHRTLGNTITNGTGAPVASVGSVGDYYIDNSNQRLYGPKSTNGWSNNFISLNLRRKLSAMASGQEIIASIYGVGYRLELPTGTGH